MRASDLIRASIIQASPKSDIFQQSFGNARTKGVDTMYPYPPDTEEERFGELCGDDFKASSGTDCTGLIPSAAVSESELENYNELYDFLPNAVPNIDDGVH